MTQKVNLNDLSHDDLIFLPTGFGNQWPELETISLVGNQLTSLPKDFS